MSHRSLYSIFCCFVVDFKEQDGEVFDSFFLLFFFFGVGAVQVLCEFSGSIESHHPVSTTDPKLSIQGPRNNLFSSYKRPFPQ